MMYGPIQVLPRGLLGFLQLKNSGKNPDKFPDVLQPTLELLRWYLASQAVDIVPSGQTAVLAAGTVGFQAYTTNPMLVPQNEIWWVENYAVQTSTLVAGDQCGFTCSVQGTPAASSGTYSMGERQGLLAGSATGRLGRAYAQDGFWLPAGFQLGVSVQVNEGAGIQFFGVARVVRIQL